jgi:D-beta-D-heptose 7-phosphate kinase / D-beta-D-heptose 1-phosphate adenosyltransferase
MISKSPISERRERRDSWRSASTPLPAPKQLRLLVAGEVILDRYVSGEVARVSPEAPIPVLRVHKREERPGNAGFVMSGLRALGGSPVAFSVVGADRNGQLLREMLEKLDIETHSLIVDPSRPTIVKERFLGSVQSANRATQQLLRVDEEDTRPLSPETEEFLVGRLESELAQSDAVVVSDINKGLLTRRVLRTLIDQARASGKPVFVDPRLTDDFSIYHGVTAITPNRYETERATGISLADESGWRQAAIKLVEQLDLKACLITLDRDGMYLMERDGNGFHIPTVPRAVYDVTGAGDVVLTVFGFCAAAGRDFRTAASLANAAAGIEVTLPGAEVISRATLEQSLAGEAERFARKILPVAELVPALERERMLGRKVSFTNGCFDLLHPGHLHALSFARSQGDLLVVAVNSDDSVRRLKGRERPVFNSVERSRILAALEMVDYVVVFDDVSAENIVRAVRPDILIKGEDYRGTRIDGQEFVEAQGGRVVFSPLVDGQSTTSRIERLSKARPPAETPPETASDPLVR